MTDALLWATCAGYVGQIVSRGALLAGGAKVNGLISAGQWWRLFTPVLLHGSPLHLAANCWSLHCVGRAAEATLGGAPMTAVYAAGALAGNLASYRFTVAPAVGASGAIFGLVGALGVYFWRHESQLDRKSRARAESLIRVVAVNLLLGLTLRNIDNWSHVGGLAGGAAAGWVVGPHWRLEKGRVVDTAPAARIAELVEGPGGGGGSKRERGRR